MSKAIGGIVGLSIAIVGLATILARYTAIPDNYVNSIGFVGLVVVAFSFIFQVVFVKQGIFSFITLLAVLFVVKGDLLLSMFSFNFDAYRFAVAIGLLILAFFNYNIISSEGF